MADSYSYDHQQQHPEQPSGAVLRRFVVFVDGMARAMIFPFGPTLVYRLVNNVVGAATADLVTPTRWTAISFQLALVIAAFLVGHPVGKLAADYVSMVPTMNANDANDNTNNNTDHKKRQTWVARLGGVAIALNIFSFGAGLSSVMELVAIRFFSAIVVGMLCAIADASSFSAEAGGSATASLDGSWCDNSHQQQQFTNPASNIASGTAKIYVTGFAVSVLSGGLFYRPPSDDNTFQAITGSNSFPWSLLFLIAATIAGEFILRRAFALASEPEHFDRSSTGSGTMIKVLKLVRRVVAGKQRASFKDNGQGSDPESLQQLLEGGGSSSGPMRKRSSTAGSAVSNLDEFHDCQSEVSDGLSPSKLTYDESDEGDGKNKNNNNYATENKDECAIYKDGKCCYADGSPAYVPQGDRASVVPANYLEDCRGNREKATRLWHGTQKWRREQGVWNILSRPNKFFYDIKRCYPHVAHGHTKNGLPIMYEQPGKMDLKKLFSGECTIDDMVHHYIFIQEFLNNGLCSTKELRKVAGTGKESDPYDSEQFGMMVVMDIKGAGISMVSTDILRYLRKVGEVQGLHYPMTMKRCCVANTPFWASGIFSTIKSVLPDSVIFELMSETNSQEKMQKYIDLDQIPEEYGGTSPYKLGEHPYEVMMREVVDRAAKGDIEALDCNESLIVSSTPEDMHMVDVNLETPRKTNIKAAPPKQKILEISSGDLPMTNKSVRRRVVGQAGGSHSPNSNLQNVYSMDQGGIGVDSLAFMSFFCAFWSGAQGGIEIAIPLWLSSPVVLGGLGYTPSRSGIAIFFAAVTIFGLLSTKASRLISNLPRSDPVRAIRIGLGIQSVCLFLLALIPIYLSVEVSSTSIFVMTVILLSLGSLASILGRSSSIILRGLVTDCASEQSSSTGLSSTFLSELTSGRPAKLLSMVGEVAGVLVISEIWSLAVNRERPSKYDGLLCLFLPALLNASLYFLSYFLHINTTTTLTLTDAMHGSGSITEVTTSAGTSERQKAV